MRIYLRTLPILGLVLVLACVWSGTALAQVAGDAVAWATRLDDAQAAAHRAGKLVLVHFYGDHCAPCKRMDAEVFPSRGVVDAISRDYVPVKIDSTQSPELVQRFGVRGIPADVILASDGRVIHKREGGIAAERYIEYLTLVARRNQTQNAAPSNAVPPVAVSVVAPPAPPAVVSAAPPAVHSAPVTSSSPWGEPVIVTSPVPSGPVTPAKATTAATSAATPTVETVVKKADTPVRPMVEIPLALDGFCPVTLRGSEKWVAGNPLFCHLYHGQIYRFADSRALEQFRAAPDDYAPVADGNDIVIFVERQRMVAGARRFGVWYQGRVFLFSSRESLEAFAKRPEFFAEIAVRYEASVGPNSIR